MRKVVTRKVLKVLNMANKTYSGPESVEQKEHSFG